MVFAAVSMSIFSGFLKTFDEKNIDRQNAKGFLFTIMGSVVGPFLGVWLSLYAVSHAKVGVASALMTTSPILLIPLSSIFLKEKIRKSGIIGTFITVVGSYMLFISKSN